MCRDRARENPPKSAHLVCVCVCRLKDGQEWNFSVYLYNRILGLRVVLGNARERRPRRQTAAAGVRQKGRAERWTGSRSFF